MTARRTIVVVDDEPGFCDTMKDLLEDEGYAVEVALDGRAGLDLIRRLTRRPCLVVLDLIMPGLDGGEVYRAIRADPQLAPTPVVIATSDPARAPHDARVLAKPVSIERLLEAVRGSCGEPSPAA